MGWSKLKELAEVLPVRPMSSSCSCGAGRHDASRAVAYPDGWHVTCLACRAEWVEWALREQPR